jgi:hypothetical protein
MQQHGGGQQRPRCGSKLRAGPGTPDCTDHRPLDNDGAEEASEGGAHVPHVEPSVSRSLRGWLPWADDSDREASGGHTHQ